MHFCLHFLDFERACVCVCVCVLLPCCELSLFSLSYTPAICPLSLWSKHLLIFICLFSVCSFLYLLVVCSSSCGFFWFAKIIIVQALQKNYNNNELGLFFKGLRNALVVCGVLPMVGEREREEYSSNSTRTLQLPTSFITVP